MANLRNRTGLGRSLWLSFVACVALLLAAPAMAQESAASKAAAETLFQQGQALMQQAKYEEACEKFRSSQQLDAGLGTLLHLADCYENLGRTASAWATFEEAASLAASRGDTPRYEIARARAAALKSALSFIVIQTKDPLPEGAMVRRDGTPLPQALLGVPIPNDPGQVTVSVVAEGYSVAQVTTTVSNNTPTPIEITLPSLEPVPVAVPGELTTSPRALGHTKPSVVEPAPDGEASTLRTWAIVAGGVGVVALGVSLVLTILANGDHEESLDDCDRNDTKSCGPTGVKLRNRALSKLGVATGFGIGGAVVLASGVVLFVSAPNGDTATPSAMGVGYRGVW